MQICICLPFISFHFLFLFLVYRDFYNISISQGKKGYCPNITFVVTASIPHSHTKLIYSHADASTYLRLLLATQ